MRFNLPAIVALILGGSAAGCANVGYEARHADGLLEFAGALAGNPHRDVAPVERVSGRAVEFVNAHAEAAGPGHTRVSGTLRNALGSGGIYNAHVDVKVLGADRRLLTGHATGYSPRPIPGDYRGQPRRASFSARLPIVPPARSVVQVSLHETRQEDCEFNRPVVPPPGVTR